MTLHYSLNTAFIYSFEVNEKLGAFYSGGPVQLSKDGQYVFTTCGNGVKVLSYGSGRVQYTIEEVIISIKWSN